MLRFFSKIRYQLAAQNKVARYLRYAIGEILLVVIGILIALQINNIKKEYENRKTEKMVLEAIKEDLKKDTVELNRLIDWENYKIKGSENSMSYFVNPDKPIQDSAQFFSDLLVSPVHFTDYSKDKTAFEMAKSSGNLFTIRNDSLVNMMGSFFSSNDLNQAITENKRFSSNYSLNLYQNYMLPTSLSYFIKDLYADSGVKEPEFPLKEYLLDFKMKNYYTNIIVRHNIELIIVKSEKENAVNLIELIDKEFTKF